MIPEATQYPHRRELARRSSCGLVVTLWWDGQSADVAVSVDDRDGSLFQLVVQGRDALHAFNHPFGVAAGSGAKGAAA